MNMLIKGIDMPKEGEMHLIISKNGIICGAEYPAKVKHTYPLNLNAQAIQIDRPHGRLKDFDGNGIHPIIVDGVYMIRVDDLDEMPTILEAEE